MIASAIACGTMVSVNQAINIHNDKRMNSMSTVAVTVNGAPGLIVGTFFLGFSGQFLSIMVVDEAVYASAYM